jgi:hypothetical protein
MGPGRNQARHIAVFVHRPASFIRTRIPIEVDWLVANTARDFRLTNHTDTPLGAGIKLHCYTHSIRRTGDF